MKTINTLGKLLVNRADKFPTNNACGWIIDNKIHYKTFKKYFEDIEMLALALNDIGLNIQDKLTILAHTRKEWNFFDHATTSNRAVLVPIYPNYLAEEIKYIINHSESNILVVENNVQFEKFINIQSDVPTIKTIVSIDKINDSLKSKITNSSINFFSYDELMAKGKELKTTKANWVRETISEQLGDDVASIVYTSGTTGEPKGAVITQEAFVSMLLNLFSTLENDFSSKDINLIFLPTSHVLGRCDSMLNLVFGLCGIYAEGIDKVIENIGLVRPTVLLAVPRIFEKIYEKISQKVASGSSITKALFQWSQNNSDNYFKSIENNQRPGFLLSIKRKIAFKLVFSKIYKRFGGKVRYFVSGGAPLSKEIVKFLRNANLTILEGYGLTETIAPCFVNPTKKQIPGSVGLPLNNVELSFAEDGEILIKTKAMFKEYYKNPEATEEALQEGWLHTGDIGKLNDDGYLVITDRKKDIIITSGGKNVAPQPIENKMKLQKYITHFLVVGDRKKFLTGIVGIERESFKENFPNLSISELSNSPEVKRLILGDIENVNKDLARFETIKDIYIAPEEFSIENGTLTPSLKLKKKVIIHKYKQEVEKLYNA